MSRRIKLITGIPRSGTTLCCKLINQRDDVVALHEPIDPAGLGKDTIPDHAVKNIISQITDLDGAIEHGRPFSHGDKGGLAIGNPVGESVKDGVRQVVARRGLVQLEPRSGLSYDLVVKQNALFCSLLPQLGEHFPIVCIVRNPVEVLLSWLTVDLPINKGHIPAGERFDPALRQLLSNQDCLSRQLLIYQWFMQRFLSSPWPCVRYEDVISSNGVILDKILGWQPIQRESLSPQRREYTTATIQTVASAAARLQALNCGDLYTGADINTALRNYGI